MHKSTSGQELHHEIFGSILDRDDMNPYLLMGTETYDSALKQATKMMGNRGFDTFENNELHESEKSRAKKYVEILGLEKKNLKTLKKDRTKKSAKPTPRYLYKIDTGGEKILEDYYPEMSS